jgi:hypothetical protein
VPDVQFGSAIRLSGDEFRQFGFLKECGLSPRRPDLFLVRTDYDAQAAIWTIVILRRPAPMPLNQWTELRANDLGDRMIEISKGSSPMYPGILFEFSSDRRSVRPTVA